MGVALFVAAFLAQAPVVAEPPTVEAVELRLALGSDPALARGLRELVFVRVGQKLSRTIVRRSIERLMESGRFSDVVVFAEGGTVGVRVIFELSPRERVKTTYVDGNKVLSDSAVLEACGFPDEFEVYPERIAQALDGLKAAYAKRGYFQAEASMVLERGGDGLSLSIDVQEGRPTTFASLSVSGDPGLPVEELERHLGLELGAVLSSAVLDEGVARLRASLRSQGFLRCRVDLPVVRPGGQVLLSVLAGPRLTLEMRGNAHFNAAYLRQVIAYDDAESLDGELLNRLARRLERFYRFKGYHEVQVEAVEEAGRLPRTVVALLKIREGLPVIVKRVHFDGNERIDDAQLRKVLRDVLVSEAPVVDNEQRLKDPLALEGRTQAGPFDEPPAPQPQTVWVESAWADAALAMTAHYQDNGFLNAQVTLGRLEIEGQTAVVTYSVNEGNQTTIEQVILSGLPEGLELEPGISMGEPFSERSVERAQRNINRDLREHGYLFNRVEASAKITEGSLARLEVTVTAGPKVTVGKIFVRGQARTSESTIRAQLEFAEGETLKPDSLAQTQRKLLALGPFRDVDIRLLSPDLVETSKDVVVEVKETTRYVLEGGLGYYLADGPRGFVDLLVPNVFGRAINFAAHGQVNFVGGSGPVLFGQLDVSGRQSYELIGGRGNVSVYNRGLLPADIGIRLDLVGERLFRPSFQFTRAAVVPGLDWGRVLTRVWGPLKLTVQLQYELEGVEVLASTDIGAAVAQSRSDEDRLRYRFGLFSLNTVRLASTLDMRDDPGNPTTGFVLQLAAERTGDLYAGLYVKKENPDDSGVQQIGVNFLKVYGAATGYLPLGPYLVAAGSVRGGSIWPLQGDSVTPPVKRFFLGGSTSLRGFREDGLIAEDQRRVLAQTRRDCEPLASAAGCTPNAKALLSGKELPSEGGELFLLTKIELRIKAMGQLQLGLFFEFGNLWLERPQGPLAFRTSAGAGLRYGTPIGPLAFDLGFNLRPDQALNEPLANFHFSIGLF
jgi:outer membrane protein assembly factor BamA